LLLFVVLRQMTGALWQSAFVAAAFGLHPLHVESVAWVTERRDVLSTLFWILAMGAYFRYVKKPFAGRYILAIVFFALGLMSKPMVVTLPVILLFLDYWPLNRFDFSFLKQAEDKRRFYALVREKVPFFVLSAISSGITYLQEHAEAVMGLEKLPLPMRLSNAAVSYIRYIWKTVWPTKLAAFYPYPIEKIPLWQVISALVVLLVITVVVLRFSGKYKYLFVGWLWYLVTLVPVIGILQVGWQAWADRYSYLTTIGLYVAFTWGAAELIRSSGVSKSLPVFCAVVLLCGMLVLTRTQVGYWQNSLTLSKHSLEVTGDNSVMYNNYGCALMNKGQYEDAVYYLNEALRIDPQYVGAGLNLDSIHSNLGLAYIQLGKHQLAVTHLKQSLDSGPDVPYALNNLAWLLATSSQAVIYDPNEAVRLALKACEITQYTNPEMMDTLAAAYAAVGNFPRAIAIAQKALNLAVSLKQNDLAGQIEKRIQCYKSNTPYRK
jgi:hypothetical protein